MIDSMNAYDINYHNFYNSHLFVCTVGAWYFMQILEKILENQVKVQFF